MEPKSPQKLLTVLERFQIIGLIRLAITKRPDDFDYSVDCEASQQVDNSSISNEITCQGVDERTTIT